MKRYVHSTEMPDGFLKTSRFTAPSINTHEKRNALEALEIAIAQKYDQFKAMLDTNKSVNKYVGYSDPEEDDVTEEGVKIDG